MRALGMKTSGLLILRRFYTTSPKELEKCRLWLSKLSPKDIPSDTFHISFARSSGPGGQNVNKVNSKATIKMNKEEWDGVDWIPVYIKNQLNPQNFPYLTKNGSLIIQSDKTRSRHENLNNCYEKLCKGIKDGVYIENEPEEKNIRKWEKINKKTNQKRLEYKKTLSDKKEGRKMKDI